MTKRLGRSVGAFVVAWCTAVLLNQHVFVGEMRLFEASGVALGCALGMLLGDRWRSRRTHRTRRG